MRASTIRLNTLLIWFKIHHIYWISFASDTVLVSGKTKMNRSDVYPAFIGAGKVAFWKRTEDKYCKAIWEGPCGTKGWSEGQCIKQGDEDQESLAKYLIISEFLIGSKKVKNSPFVLWHIPGEGGEYSMPLVSTLGRWKAANAPRLSSICGLEWRGEKAQGRRNSSLLLSFKFRLPCKVSGLPSPPRYNSALLSVLAF